MDTPISANQMQDKVNAICNDLYAKGQKVSVRVVLSMMPEVSSTSTVHKYYKQWKEELEANQKSLLEKMGFSPEFTRVFMAEITRHATEAERRYREIADDAKEQSAKAIEDLERVEERLHKQTAVLEQKDNLIKTLQAELAETKKTQEAVSAELRLQIDELTKTANEKAEVADRLRTELAKKELQLENNQQAAASITEENELLREQVKEKVEQMIEQAKAITRLESSLDAKTALLDELKQDKQSLSQKNQDLDAELRDLQQSRYSQQTSLNEAQSREQNAQTRIDDLVKAIAEAKATIAQQSATITRYESLLDTK
ncbi:DNA-binding protein [Vibrio vulnificus]|uniref:DNA-binding protein n=1 Tax=Vibrio vulnificus TaxID=672 RepID=UPI00102944D8|nr:DNA-binding protein [Vibrio vulnificus]EJE8535841.1 DNA-binding protein [Vibrio vulnificus]EKO5187802.1 DNA-binding protein [Vibrio vulnificus]ELH7807779.1 DNA-binding protein [Vibrio vulnificus]RZR34209.1 mfp1 (mar binding filament 1) [Vibrio vulnificus]HAS8111148.1 mfp1 (mar binding filament 1) [Vibrio vulnificus]